MLDHLMLKAILVPILTLFAAMQAVFATDAVTQAIGGAATLIGLAGLIWKLLFDARVDSKQFSEMQSLVDTQKAAFTAVHDQHVLQITLLRDRVKELEVELQMCQKDIRKCIDCKKEIVE